MKPADIKPEIPFATLAAVDLRVGTIQTVHDVTGSSKLIRMVVDFGDTRATSSPG
jgi:tRNA-binding EMAP/Myf-like protein